MIIDIHAHTSAHKLWGLHTSTATLNDLNHQAEKFGICKTILMATYFPFKGTGLANRELFRRIKSKEQFSMMASLNVSGDFESGVCELEEMLNIQQVVGIKLYPGYQNFSPAENRMDDVYGLAERFGVPIMVHGGELHHCCSQENRRNNINLRCGKKTCPLDELGYLSRPGQIDCVAKKFPNVKFIISHLSSPYFEELRELMSKRQNVYTDISGLMKSGSPEVTPKRKEMFVGEIRKFLKVQNGINRIMFGTDFPIQSYEDSVNLIEDIGLSESEEQKIFFQNANRLFDFDRRV